MKKLKFFILPLWILGVAGFWGCSDDDDEVPETGPCSTEWAIAVEDEAQAWVDAAQVYAAAQTTENCNNYKVAAQAYLDALEPYEDCTVLTGQQRADWQEALDNARLSVENLNCSTE